MTVVASETIQFSSDNVTIRAYLACLPSAQGRQAEPPCAPSGSPGILIIHEWWGLNDHIKDIARRFANAGYVALAPALYSRLGYKVTKDPNEAASLMNALSAQWALRDLNAATTYLKQQPFADPLRLGIVGFGMGGTIALTQATHNSDLKASVVFYGKVPPLETCDYLLCPVLYHYAAQDGWVTKQEVDRLRQGLSQFGKPGDIATYPNCQHAFFNDTCPEVYSEPDARLAWDRTQQFFKQHLT